MKLVISLTTILIFLGVVSLMVLPGEAEEPVTRAGELSPEDLDKVATFMAARMIEFPETRGFSDEEVLEATGVVLPDGCGTSIQGAVFAKLGETEEGKELLASLGEQIAASCAPAADGAACATESRCAEFAACSLGADLTGATGKTLQMYQAEKALDGTTFDDFVLPEFEALDLQGNPVSSRDLEGAPAVVVLLAGHCGHSIASIKVLQDVKNRYADQDVRIVGVFLNSGSVESVANLMRLYRTDYEVWVYPDATLGEAVGTRLVPSYFWVDAEGQVKQKLVGMKNEEQLSTFVDSYLE